MKRPIVVKVERSSLGTQQARAARRTVRTSVAAKLVKRAEAEQNQQRPQRRLGGGRPAAT